MFGLRRTAAALSLAAAIASVPVTTLAATTYSLSGVETYADASTGKFAGFAFASDDYGTWKATVVHGPLPTSVGDPAAAITGGTFALDGKVRDLAGTIDSGGAITLLTTSTCGKQTYSVTGTLLSGAAAFAATLTHYRTSIFGYCLTYAATVRGFVSF
jgi:hypothetical protein